MAKFKRKIVQVLTAIITNGYLPGFIKGDIYRGNLKRFCVPGLNCYSCPGALGSCPIGSLQAVIGSAKYQISFYVLGTIAFIGTLLGRFVCGWLCPFGLIQELLHKIPSKKVRISSKNPAKYSKYLILLVFVIILPMFVVNVLGMGDPFFCKYICPAGTLEAGIPLVIMNPSLRQAIGFIFSWKVFLLILTIIASVFIARPFCRFICPLGAIYGLFNPISLYKLEVSSEKCIKCNKCTKTCPISIETYKTPNSPECVRCGKCIGACPTQAICSSFGFKEKEERPKEIEIN